jgi:glycosyltransferase involved in cell wall biosynthesis
MYLDGQSLRYGGAGGSGTDTSTILVAEHLAAHGHDVTIVSDKFEPPLAEKLAQAGQTFNSGRVVNGVQYCDSDLAGIRHSEYEILVSSLWYQDYANLPVKITKALIYWCHMQWIYGVDEMIVFAQQNNLKLGFVHISDWERSMNYGIVASANDRYACLTAQIPNPVPDDVLNQVRAENIVRKPHKFIFHASWPRGGDVALEVVRRLPYPDKEFHAFDYLMVIHQHTDNFFNMHGGVDKVTLFRELASSEYFVYPLYTPYQDVHKDTFSCVVAEAIAMGCVPITYPLGALPENFDGYCHWVPFPAGADPAVMQAEPLSKDIPGLFKSEEAVDNLIAAVNHLDGNPELKLKIRTSGAQFILDRLSVAMVGQRWMAFIEELAG